MATGQDLLDTMELLDQELQLQPGENDVTRALVALNRSQDHWEALLAKRPRHYGGTTYTVATVGQQEYTTMPTGCLRIDRIQNLDPNSLRPTGPDLDFLGYAGSHTNTLNASVIVPPSEAQGRPSGYWTDGAKIWWAPLPDTVYSLRVYGLAAQANITAGGTFAYLDYVILPMATLAVKLMNIGVDDSADAYDRLAEQVFRPALDSLYSFVQDRAPGYDYTQTHTE